MPLEFKLRKALGVKLFRAQMSIEDVIIRVQIEAIHELNESVFEIHREKGCPTFFAFAL